MNSEPIPGCRRCYEEEATGKTSLRMRYNKRPDFAAQVDIQVPSLKWIEMSFSNRCNMACRMCDERYSSRWARLGERHASQINKDVQTKLDERINEVIDLSSSLFHIKITGGEPFLDPRHTSFLEQIVSKGRSKEIFLNYSTNGTRPPDTKIVDLWSQFMNVEVSMSFDSVEPEHFEYLRWPVKYSSWMHHVKEWLAIAQEKPFITLGARPTVSILNLSSLPATLEWWWSNRTSDWLNPTHVTFPIELSTTVFPLAVKEYLKAELISQSSSLPLVLRKMVDQQVLYMLSRDDSHLWPLSLKFLAEQDAKRGQDYRAVYPFFGAPA